MTCSSVSRTGRRSSSRIVGYVGGMLVGSSLLLLRSALIYTKCVCVWWIYSSGSMMLIECGVYLPFESQGWVGFPTEHAPPHAHDGFLAFPALALLFSLSLSLSLSVYVGNITIKPTRALLRRPTTQKHAGGITKNHCTHTHTRPTHAQLLQCGIMS